VPYYPPVIPASAWPSQSAKDLYADGLSKLRRITDSCGPLLLLSCKHFLRAKWVVEKVLWGDAFAWPAVPCKASDDLYRNRRTATEPAVRALLDERLSAAPGVAFLQYTSGSTGHPRA
jgi:acyl-CoA synthetase (AMP-forming)/AMP-acid ligase II